MAKIQLDAVPMLPTSGKTGRAQTAEKGAFKRLLKDSDRKTAAMEKPSKASESDSEKNQSVSKKDETPVDDSSPNGKENPDAVEDSGTSDLSAQQFLLLQGMLNQAVAAIPEENLSEAEETQMLPEQMDLVGMEAVEEVMPQTAAKLAVPETVPELAANDVQVPTEDAKGGMMENLPETVTEEVLPETAISEERSPIASDLQENSSVLAENLTGVPTAAEQAAEAGNAPQQKEAEDLSSFVLKNARQNVVEAAEEKTAQKVKAVAEETRAAVEKFQSNINDSAAAQTEKQTAGQEENRSQTESGQNTQHWQAGVLPAESRSDFLSEGKPAESIPVQTSEANLVNDVARTIANRFPQNNGTLTIELEPASLGKLTIQVLYEGGKATVSILASNPKTLELLNQKASEMASILEERTGQETIVYTEPPEPRQPYEERQGGREQKEREPEDKEEKKKSEGDSFAQQLRLGLI